MPPISLVPRSSFNARHLSGIARVAWAILALAPVTCWAQTPASPTWRDDIQPLFKARCVKCHGPLKREGKLILQTAAGLRVGGESGAAFDAQQPTASLIWRRVEAGEMPPNAPLTAAEQDLLRRWLQGGANDLQHQGEETQDPASHWAFQPLRAVIPPEAAGSRTAVDGFVTAALAPYGLSLSSEAERGALLRRLSFDLRGLPPSPDEVTDFLQDERPDAFDSWVDRYLLSPAYGERWGKFWLDAAGYADSNGYFNADSDRPLAWRYRDYVIEAFNADLPFDRFIQEQLAGDELSGFRADSRVTPVMVAPLTATHFLRNAQDGTGESDGNSDEVRTDKYSVLEGAVQIMGSSLFGLTLQCARCHDHKFEPVTQRDYYRLQAILFPAFNVEAWIKPNDRFAFTATAEETATWQARIEDLDRRAASLKQEFSDWASANRERGHVLFEDTFDGASDLAAGWTNTAPGDDGPAGSPPVEIGGGTGPAARLAAGVLEIVDGGDGNRWLSTRQAFDWTPDEPGQWTQATFDLVDDKLTGDAAPAARIGYYLATGDFDDQTPGRRGNILIDGNPAGGAAVHVDYPGADAQQVGQLGSAGYAPRQSFGVRVTSAGDGKYVLSHVVDGVPEEATLELAAGDLPDGGFGFEYCCGRSFVVDNVRVETGPPQNPADGSPSAKEQLGARRQALAAALKELDDQRSERPGKLAAVYETSTEAPHVFLLERGVYSQPGAKVEPGPPAVLDVANHLYEPIAPPAGASTGRRLGLAQWLTRPGSRAGGLLARVTVNRIWQQHFGVGLVSTPDNLGLSGAPPDHPELLEFLASELVASGWSVKHVQRLIVRSATFRQVSHSHQAGLAADPANRLYWRFPLRRLDAESVRDAMLELAGELDGALGGPYVPTRRADDGEVLIDEDQPGARRRSVYAQQRRTQVLSLLDVYDAPSLVTNCTRRSSATMPLQSLSALNSAFVVARAQALAARVREEAGDDTTARLERVFLLVASRVPTVDERAASQQFLMEQPARYPDSANAQEQAWVDMCQMLLASNAFLYVE